MAGRIPQDFIDELVERADIAEVIGKRVQLKKAGREYKACCPFHSEKTPSFTVSPQKGFYHCFGCGAHGTALGFLMDYERLEFVDAVEDLAHSLGLEVPRDEQAERRTPVAPVFETLDKAARLYRTALKDHPAAVDYLKRRGLDGETAARFGVGYAPASWDFLLRQLPDTDEARQQLLAAGLIMARDNGGYYDRFRDRIMFPIRDSRGRTVAFGGRVLDSGEPKYLNSPETSVFHKGRELYALYDVRRAHRKPERLLVVEGYMDVIGLSAHGINIAVATLGTATTPEHLRRLFRATSEIVFCFDGDRAGRDAAWRALHTSLPEMKDGNQVGFLFLPDGEDPDSLIRAEGADAFAARIEQAKPLSDYLLEELAKQSDVETMDGRARLAELAKPMLARIPGGVYRELLTERLAATVHLNAARLSGLMDDGAAEARPAPRQRPRLRRPADARRSLVRRAIQLVINYPGRAGQLQDLPALTEINQRGVPLLAELLEIARRSPEITPAGLLERFRDRSEGGHLQALLAEEEPLGDAGAQVELMDCLIRISGSAEHQRLAELSAKASASGLTSAEKDEMRLLRRDSTNDAQDETGVNSID